MWRANFRLVRQHKNQQHHTGRSQANKRGDPGYLFMRYMHHKQLPSRGFTTYVAMHCEPTPCNEQLEIQQHSVRKTTPPTPDAKHSHNDQHTRTTTPASHLLLQLYHRRHVRVQAFEEYMVFCNLSDRNMQRTNNTQSTPTRVSNASKYGNNSAAYGFNANASAVGGLDRYI